MNFDPGGDSSGLPWAQAARGNTMSHAGMRNLDPAMRPLMLQIIQRLMASHRFAPHPSGPVPPQFGHLGAHEHSSAPAQGFIPLPSPRDGGGPPDLVDRAVAGGNANSMPGGPPDLVDRAVSGGNAHSPRFTLMQLLLSHLNKGGGFAGARKARNTPWSIA